MGGIIQEMGSRGRDGLDRGLEKKDKAVNNKMWDVGGSR